MATDLAGAEKALGLDTVVCDTFNKDTWDKGMDADVHVIHSHIPDKLAFDTTKKIVAFQHGSPEHSFQVSVEQGINHGYGAGDSLSIGIYFVKRADAIVTFWERHGHIWESMTSKPVYVIPMGVDRSFWTQQEGVTPLAGEPSVFTAENSWPQKWPLDLVFFWPRIVEAFPEARLHALNLPQDQMRFWTELAVSNSTHYTSYMYTIKLDHDHLRNFFSASSYYYSPVHYGDHNRVSMEASACGCKVISFEGNEYADYWIREGNGQRQADDLIAILKGEVEPRQKEDVPDLMDTAQAMLTIYGKIGVL